MKPQAALEVLCCAPMGADLVFGGLDSFPAPGREAFCRQFSVLPGGGANTFYALHRLGISTALVSGLGNDVMGGLMRDFFAEQGLSTAGLVPAPGTAVSAVLPYEGDRGFATWLPPQNWQATAQKLGECLPASALLHTSSYNCAHLDVPGLCGDIPFSADACWHEELDLRQMEATLAACRFFFINQTELQKLTGETQQEKGLRLLEGATRCVVLKLGEGGCLLCQNGSRTALPAANAGPAVDATGAGDAFCAGFLYGHAKGFGAADCARLANACGAVAVAQAGGLAQTLTPRLAHRLAGLPPPA